jgi:hypothetical protein
VSCLDLHLSDAKFAHKCTIARLATAVTGCKVRVRVRVPAQRRESYGNLQDSY